jgi:hypothetical protein
MQKGSAANRAAFCFNRRVSCECVYRKGFSASERMLIKSRMYLAR